MPEGNTVNPTTTPALQRQIDDSLWSIEAPREESSCRRLWIIDL